MTKFLQASVSGAFGDFVGFFFSLPWCSDKRCAFQRGVHVLHLMRTKARLVHTFDGARKQLPDVSAHQLIFFVFALRRGEPRSRHSARVPVVRCHVVCTQLPPQPPFPAQQQFLFSLARFATLASGHTAQATYRVHELAQCYAGAQLGVHICAASVRSNENKKKHHKTSNKTSDTKLRLQMRAGEHLKLHVVVASPRTGWPTHGRPVRGKKTKEKKKKEKRKKFHRSAVCVALAVDSVDGWCATDRGVSAPRCVAIIKEQPSARCATRTKRETTRARQRTRVGKHNKKNKTKNS